jgi:hypothetical protein
MRLSINVIIQALAMAGQALNAVLDFVPPGKKPVVAGMIGIVQAVVAFMAHFSNPDGTAAGTPYVSKNNKP